MHLACISVDTKIVPVWLSHAATFVTVENKTLNTLIDSCASKNLISKKIAVSENFSFFEISNYDPEKC